MNTTNALTTATKKLLRGGAVSAAAFCLVAGSAYAATTISANVATTGTLTVDGTVTLGDGEATAEVDSSNWGVTTGGDATFANVAGDGSDLTSLTAESISAGTAAIDISGNAATADALFANGANCGAGSAPLGMDASGAVEGCTAYLGSALLDGMIFVGNGSDVATAVAMSGDATISNTGVVTVTQNAYAMFYGLTAGTGMAGTDYASTVAAGAAVPFPQDGPALGGIVSTTDTTFTIPEIGTYEVTFHVHATEPGQLQLAVDNGAGFVVAHECTGENFNPTSGGHPIVGNCIITTTDADAVVKVINPAGNATALTITPADGANTHANSQTLVIKQL